MRNETESFAAVTHILEPFLVLPPVVKHGTIAETITKTLATISLPDGSENINQILASHGGTYMFARFLEMTIKLDKKAELIRKVKEEILPILRKYNGFFDLIPLDVETEPTKFYAISLWHERADLEKYTKENFPKVKAMVDPFLTAPIIVKHCTVDETIPKKFMAAAMA